jgi:hypothetical protein
MDTGLGPGGFVAVLFFASVIGFAVWVHTQSQDAAWTFRFPLGEPPTNVEESAVTIPGNPNPDEPPPASSPDDPPPSAPAEIRRASSAPEVADTTNLPDPVVDLREAALAVPELVSRLFEADSPEARAACVDAPELHTDSIESFFAATNGQSRPGFTHLQQFSAVPLTLPEKEPSVLFQVKTDANPRGALLSPVRDPQGEWKISWPLFQETHERVLESYLQSPDDQPRWFHVGLRPSHGFDIPAELRDTHFTYDLQGSADTATRVLALVKKNSPLGRYLRREVEWGEIYLARVLIRWSQFAPDAEGLEMVDCEGMNSPRE